MKKILALLLALAMLVSLTACGGNSENSSSQQEPPVSSQAESEPAVSEPAVSTPEPESTLDEVSSEVSEVSSEPAESEKSEPTSHILVAYFSRVGNTVWEDGVDAITSASLNTIDGEFYGNAQLLAGYAQEITGGDLFLIETEETYPSDYRETTDAAKVEQNEDARPVLSSHVENMEQYDTIVLIYPNWWGDLPMPLYTFLEESDFAGKTILPLCTHEGSGLSGTKNTIAGLCPGATVLEGLSVRGGSAASARQDVEEWLNSSGTLE